MELYSAGPGNGMRGDCIFEVLDYDERPLWVISGPSGLYYPNGRY